MQFLKDGVWTVDLSLPVYYYYYYYYLIIIIIIIILFIIIISLIRTYWFMYQTGNYAVLLN